MNSFATRPNFYAFFPLWGRLKANINAATPMTIADFIARFSTAVTKTSWRVGHNVMRLTAFCLEMDKGCIENLLQL
jgi:hypothetical protein